MDGLDVRKRIIGDETPDDELMDDGDELRDDADDFEDALLAEMTRTGAIEIW